MSRPGSEYYICVEYISYILNISSWYITLGIQIPINQLGYFKCIDLFAPWYTSHQSNRACIPRAISRLHCILIYDLITCQLQIWLFMTDTYCIWGIGGRTTLPEDPYHAVIHGNKLLTHMYMWTHVQIYRHLNIHALIYTHTSFDINTESRSNAIITKYHSKSYISNLW